MSSRARRYNVTRSMQEGIGPLQSCPAICAYLGSVGLHEARVDELLLKVVKGINFEQQMEVKDERLVVLVHYYCPSHGP